MFSELRSSCDAKSLLENNALQAINDLKRGEHDAAVANEVARRELKVQFDEQLATFRLDFQSRHDRAMLDACASVVVVDDGRVACCCSVFGFFCFWIVGSG